MIAWMMYAALVAGIVAVGGLAMERLAAAMGQPRRIAWLAALALAVAIPLTGGWREAPTASVVVVELGTTEPVVAPNAPGGDFWSAMPTLPIPDSVANGRIALFAWGAGSLAALAVLAAVLVQVARGRRRWDRARVHGAEVYVSRRFGPALVGVARPEVVIPAWVLEMDPRAREAIIRHEVEHARARDHLVLLCGGLVLAAFPWSPAIWWMYRRLRAAVELDCDQRVLASGIEVADYGDVLLGAGCRSRGRWGFSPAMGQPESLLERRLKTMSETGRKLSGGYAALLVAVAVGALVAACDTPVPTEVREAFEEVMADEEAQGADAEQEDWIERFLGASTFGPDPAPLLYVDGVRIRSEEDLKFATEVYLGDVETGQMEKLAQSIDRIEVLKGPAAEKLYGDEAAGGVIQIFTHDGGIEAEVIEVVALPSVEEAESVQLESGKDLTIGVAVVPSLDKLVVRGDTLVVWGAKRDKWRAALEYVVEPSVDEIRVRGTARVMERPSDWDRWLAVRAARNAPSDSKPVIYVDGVRVDGGGAGLITLHPALAPEHIDRIEVIKGEYATEKYGEEAANGVILIFTKERGSLDEPSGPRSR